VLRLRGLPREAAPSAAHLCTAGVPEAAGGAACAAESAARPWGTAAGVGARSASAGSVQAQGQGLWSPWS